MIKEREIVMVNAATIALEYKSKHPRAWDDDAVAHAFKSVDTTPELKIYGLAAANEVLKLKKANPSTPDKQIIQEFVNNIYAVLAKINEGLGKK